MKYEKIRYEHLLSRVDKPSRYIGLEINTVNKQVEKDKLNFCLAFPDVYEVGIAHLGLKILYSILNNEYDTVADRTYAPWTDFAELMRSNNIPLFSLENKIAVKDFDAIGFTLQSELNFSNVPYMLKLAGISEIAEGRKEDDPIIVGGGPSISNPEPLSLFFDAIFIGEAEEGIIDIKNCLLANKSLSRKEKLLALSKIESVYVPSINDGTSIVQIRKYNGFHTFENSHDRQLIPWQQPTHDRYVAEIMRGCGRGCRFCHAGYFYRPVREREPDKIIEKIVDEVSRSGWEEASLTSLSSSDYSVIKGLLYGLFKRISEHRAIISLPSLRVDTLDSNLTELLNRLGQKGLTIAPEAGSQRLRNVINKNISEEEIMEGVQVALQNGWRVIKLYFMIGLPFEKIEDIWGIIELVEKIVSLAGKKLSINITLSPFIPKPFTPFQWAGMFTRDEIYHRVRLIKDRLARFRFIKVRYHDIESSQLEAILTRGDRRIGNVIKRAVDKGACFDGWQERFNFSIWQSALEEEGITLEECLRSFNLEERLPWDHISIKVNREFLLNEWMKAQEEITTPSCMEECTLCGVCDEKTGMTFAKTKLLEAMQLPERIEPDNLVKVYFYRVFFHKTGGLQYVSHLDFLRMIHRILRGIELDLAYSQGFNLHPKVRFGPPLSVGVEGLNEYIEVGFYQQYQPEIILTALKRLMKNELAVNSVEFIESKEKIIVEEVGEEIIEVIPNEGISEKFRTKTCEYLGRDSFPIERERKGKIKQIELKEIIKKIEWENGVLRVRKKLQGASIFHILENVYGIPRDETSKYRIVRTRILF
ncbi:MAG: TIGR03960 family B12-binding radical SAM protein [Candidatus Cloacimonetes bacterium]|nr:TIGR03960 family B12-binding radical SAM protein [Candidatus Cloacimonadota bacterium]